MNSLNQQMAQRMEEHKAAIIREEAEKRGFKVVETIHGYQWMTSKVDPVGNLVKPIGDVEIELANEIAPVLSAMIDAGTF